MTLRLTGRQTDTCYFDGAIEVKAIFFSENSTLLFCCCYFEVMNFKASTFMYILFRIFSIRFCWWLLGNYVFLTHAARFRCTWRCVYVAKHGSLKFRVALLICVVCACNAYVSGYMFVSLLSHGLSFGAHLLLKP